MLEEIPARLFQEWMLYHAIEPFGPWGDDHRAGMIVTAVAKQWGGGLGAKPSNFFHSLKEPGPDPEDEDEVREWEERRARRMGVLAQAHAAINRDSLR